ncbi:MAG: elongation factor G [Proteobacteria bacterium]|nr:elongation factor G [Pseudomonadota bacterium]
MSNDIADLRNIGISAHIDSGKTTLTERILFYTGRIHAIHDVRGKDGVGAKMDSMELEKERGITIQSAATHCHWKDKKINIIDTPGHVDFTIEVERSLRVLDGAILVLCSVAGVQSQSITVDRQMRRYNVPRIAFINKCDRQGANPFRVKDQLIDKLKLNAAMVQIPIGLEENHLGVVDLVNWKAYYFEGDNGENIREEEIPAELLDQALEYRETLLDAVSGSQPDEEFGEELMMLQMDESDGGDRVPAEALNRGIREATIALKLCPVMMGSAYKNKGVQPLLDSVSSWLPCPTEVPNEAMDAADEKVKHEVLTDSNKPLCALAFKLEDGRYGQLTYIRVYQGTLKKGDTIYNVRSKNKIKVGRLVRMHSDEMEDIDVAQAGDIVALFGVDCFSGDSFTDGSIWWVMASIHVPEPVISMAIKPKNSKSQANMSKALQRFKKEDPTFQVHSDIETNETIVSGMGELHLEVYIERMKREYKAEVETSPPRVSYREAITQKSEFNYTHKKQTGGAGQFGRVAGYIEPIPAEETTNYDFIDQIKGGVIPREFIPSCDKGFQQSMEKGRLIEAPVVNIRVCINDGAYHPVDSSDNAFQAAARGAWRAAFDRAKPIVLEPVMKVSVEGPTEFQGNIIGTLNQRRGSIIGMGETDGYATIDAEVPLSEMFGYSTVLRSSTQGKAEFTMEFSKYSPAPVSVQEDLIAAYQEERKNS